GLACALAHPPFGMLPGLLGYSLILLRLETIHAARPVRTAFGLGWLAGLGYFGVSTWWIAEPFLVDVRTYGWMAPFAVALMGGGLALFWGAAAACYRALRPRSAWKVLVFAGVFSAAEWLRGHVFTGFPWDLPGETWAAGSAPSQAAALVGVYGLTWITLALAAAPAILILPVRRLAQAGLLVAAGVGLTMLYAGGAGRLAASARTVYAPDAPMIRVVQANIDQKDKWKPENLGLVFDAYAGLTARPAAQRPDIVIWPEGALPAVIDDLIAPGSPFAPKLRDLVQPGQTLLMGANRAEPAGAAGDYRYFNTLVAFRRDPQALRVTGYYDKYRLVPFGEFIPLGKIAGKLGFRSLVHMPDDFTAGPPPRPLVVEGVPAVQPLICYEALFPRLAQGPRPKWILNVSNDAWFGKGSGPLQHLNIASYRAIEQGLPIVRATPTGVSAIIDAEGRILPGKRLGLGDFGVIDARLPDAAAPTPYSRLGDSLFVGLLGLSVLAWVAGRRRRPRPEVA
ncbi:MAG TPA: apolipoprotein N-acyltransferase, partial [Phenylobacterium sp.]|nr:apolipoprotein N-acyltransferase [Phenylobacterium sp.]